MTGGDGPDLRDKVALACRIAAMEGLASGTLGHVSARAGDDRMLIRTRGPLDRGVLFTTADDVKLVDFDGAGNDLGAHAVPNELPIHGEILRARTDVGAVVHVHPPAVLTCGVAGLELRPIFGAYDIPAMALAAGGIPTYPRSVLIRTPQLGRDVLATMGARPVCVLRGHGIVTIGETVEQALARAIELNVLATATVEVARTGRTAEPIPADDIAELPDLGSSFNDDTLWRHYAAKAELHGLWP